MLTRPPECSGCPLNDKALGFSRPEGRGSLGVLILGEALGEEEAGEGFPFRPHAPAGSLLERTIKSCGWDRQQFTLWNVVACQPPRNWLNGAPWEAGAIEHCRVHRERVLHNVHPRVIFGLGDTALRAMTGHAGKKRGISHLRGYALPTQYGIPFIGSYHPAFLRRGKMAWSPILAADLRRAVWLAANGVPATRPTAYQLRPSLDDAEAFYLCARDNPGMLLTYDIETPYSGGEDEDAEQDGDASYDITQIQFSLAPGEGIVFPWKPPYIDIARRLLALPNEKANHNTYEFDVPRLAAAQCPIAGLNHDTRWMFHHLQPAWPGHLQFVASFYGMEEPWKHTADLEPERYGAADVDAVQRIMARLPDDLRKMGVWRGYEQHILRLNPILVRAAERGMPVSEPARQEFGARVRAEMAAEDESIQKLVPDALKGMHPKLGYKIAPSGQTGLLQGEFLVPWAELTRGERECALLDGVREGQAAKVTRWYRPKPFLPNSGDQIIAYMKAQGHPIPKDIKSGDETTTKKELERLGAKTGDPLYPAIIRYREMNKMLSTYVEAWKPDAAGRVHSHFYYTPATGQLASHSPNIQNGPKHSALAKAWRRTVQAEPGHVLVEFDFRSAHALTLGFEAGDPDYMRLARLDIHSYLAAHLLKLPEREKALGWSDEELAEYLKWVKSNHGFVRDKKAKPTVLGYGFGLGWRKLYDMNRESFEKQSEAKGMSEMLDALFPRTAAFRDAIRQKAHEQGFLKSRHGYIRHFSDVYHNAYNKREGRWEVKPGEDSEAAIAFLPANDAFGHIKDCMLRLDARGWLELGEFINTVHDSLMFHPHESVLDSLIDGVYYEMTRPSDVLVDDVVAPNGLAIGVSIAVGHNWSSAADDPEGMKEVGTPCLPKEQP